MKKVFLLIFLILVAFLHAQYPITIDVNPTTRTYNILYPAYFNPEDSGNQPNLFTVTFSGDPVDFVIHVTMQWYEYSAFATLNPDISGEFPPPLTNQEIINTNPLGFSIQQNFDKFLEDIEDQIVETGRMPDGNYYFEIACYQPGHEDQAGYEVSNKVFVTITIRSPISISLITPGNPIGLGPAPISDSYPNFIWFSNFIEYTIKVFEIDGEYTTPEEIELLDPYFEDLCTITSYLYPTDAPDLMIGRTYAWQVSADVSTPVGEEGSYKSIIYSFLISTDQEDEMNNQILINFLEQLSIEGLEELIALINSGYDVKNIFWQGSTISMDELNDILEQIANGDLIIENISVE